MISVPLTVVPESWKGLLMRLWPVEKNRLGKRAALAVFRSVSLNAHEYSPRADIQDYEIDEFLFCADKTMNLPAGPDIRPVGRYFKVEFTP